MRKIKDAIGNFMIKLFPILGTEIPAEHCDLFMRLGMIIMYVGVAIGVVFSLIAIKIVDFVLPR